MNQDAEDRRREREARRALMDKAMAALRSAINRTPFGHSAWNHERALDYKDAMIAGQKLLKSKEPKLQSVLDVTRKIDQFHR